MKDYTYWIGFLCGCVLGVFVLVVGVVPQPVQGETAIGSQGIQVINGNINSESQDLIYVFDTNTMRLAAYAMSRSGALNLQDVRSVKYDLQLDYIRRQRPSIMEIRKKVKKVQ